WRAAPPSFHPVPSLQSDRGENCGRRSQDHPSRQIPPSPLQNSACRYSRTGSRYPTRFPLSYKCLPAGFYEPGYLYILYHSGCSLSFCTSRSDALFVAPHKRMELRQHPCIVHARVTHSHLHQLTVAPEEFFRMVPNIIPEIRITGLEIERYRRVLHVDIGCVFKVLFVKDDHFQIVCPAARF